MESTHRAKNVNVSVRKVRMLLPAVKKVSPEMALIKLAFMPHSAAVAIRQAVQTALANASSALKVPKNMLEFRTIKADQGLVMKRFRAGSRGSPRPVLRRMTHITVVLGEKKVAPAVTPVAGKVATKAVTKLSKAPKTKKAKESADK